ncbi:hypothetical protein B0T26DRAFT_876365 [Lasiosphaeria miniovina]|uniref:Uncharacterized protein n=1 Tax=Lasiosphaeria miniovina TaxID=1954250 RepID=A0AA39ZTN0_9PEZI|nr:uncharacterized protein B0T26DRAFT_876365 [Lasiosphaeria miniovina]KAK0703358.1 hypothetical protein B0T26DRAFT_876365 [Lasiosphaeria miniovina]
MANYRTALSPRATLASKSSRPPDTATSNDAWGLAGTRMSEMATGAAAEGRANLQPGREQDFRRGLDNAYVGREAYFPGSYRLHGHGVVTQDKLEKAYFEKHPDLLVKEHTPHHHDRPYDFSMSSDDLNRIVRDTASRGSGLAVKDPGPADIWEDAPSSVHYTAEVSTPDLYDEQEKPKESAGVGWPATLRNL